MTDHTVIQAATPMVLPSSATSQELDPRSSLRADGHLEEEVLCLLRDAAGPLSLRQICRLTRCSLAELQEALTVLRSMDLVRCLNTVVETYSPGHGGPPGRREDQRGDPLGTD
jgi:hypothetical protein